MVQGWGDDVPTEDDTVLPVYSGHLRDLKKVSAIDRCPLYRGFLYLNDRDSAGTDPDFLSAIAKCPLYRVSAIDR